MIGVLAVAFLLAIIAGVLLQVDSERIDVLEWDEDEQDAQDLMDILFLDEEEELL